MKFKDLRKSVLFSSSDFDDMEVMICVARNGQPQYEPLCFMGFVPSPDIACVVIGGLTEIQRRVESGVMEAPEGYVPPSQAKKHIEGDEETY